MNTPRTQHMSHGPLYRSRGGMVAGVCKGIAEKFSVSLFWLRVIVIVSTAMSGVFPGIIIYGIAALLLKPAPPLKVESDEDLDFYMTYSSSKKLALSRLNRHFNSLEDRIKRMESIVTDKAFTWEQRLNSGQ